MFLLAISLLSLAIWLYLTFLHGHFWSSGPALPAATPAEDAPSVAVVIPARDEAESIVGTIRSLLDQQYSGPLHIILVDDNSTDGTAELARNLVQERKAEGAISILAGAPLAEGWSGKLWAVHQGLAHPRALDADYVLLTDADILHAPAHIATLVAKAEIEGLDLVSEMVRLSCATFWERALIPAFIFFFQMLYPFARVNDPRSAVAGAAGGTVLLSRAAVDRIEGVSRIRFELIDDCALAATVKRSGGRIWLGHSELAISTRIYRSASEIWRMIARTAYVQLRHSPLLLLGCVAGLLATYIVPPVLAFAASGPAQIAAIVTWGLMGICFQPTLRRYHRISLWGFALPLIALFYLAATVASAIAHYRGQGGGWKNRVYPSSGA